MADPGQGRLRWPHVGAVSLTVAVLMFPNASVQADGAERGGRVSQGRRTGSRRVLPTATATASPRPRWPSTSSGSDQEIVDSRELWVEAGLESNCGPVWDAAARPASSSAEQVQKVEHWIKSAVFQIDPANPDPGRVTVRRLNRTEYRNTIRDLIGVNFNTDAEFPADDTGHGRR